MLVIESVEGLVRALEGRRPSGLVPTMGALHGGHLSLVQAARRGGDVVVLSAFANPLQFGPDEDLATYPADRAGDASQAEAAGVDVLFVPSVEEMYPDPPLATVHVAGLGQVLEGARRPGHFEGVATVVTKLLHLVAPRRAYFGEKDYQQLLVVRRMVADLNILVEVVGCPVVRDADGLALSSRNRLLDPRQRGAAPVLYRALEAGRDAVLAGARRAEEVEQVMAGVVGAEPLADLEYAAVVAADTLAPAPSPLAGVLRLLVAAGVGPVRLIDNLEVLA